MNWHNLKSNKCPMCNKDLIAEKIKVKCSSCRFSVNTNRFQEIVMSMNERALQVKEEKQGFDRFDDFNESEEEQF